MHDRLRFVLATVVAFVLLTLLWLSPLLPSLQTAFVETAPAPTLLMRADGMLTSWLLAWGSHALRTDPLGLFHANIFHPLPWTLAFSENLLASAALVTPVDLVWRNPVLDHNVLLLGSFALSGIGTALLARELGCALPAAWLAGALVAFEPFRFGEIGHLHALSTHWIPFALLALQRCLRRGRGALAVALTVLLVTLSSVYHAYFFLLALAVFVPMHGVLGAPAAPGGRARAVAGIAVATGITAIVFAPYALARDLYALARDPGEAWLFAVRGTTYLGGVTDAPGYLTTRWHATAPTAVIGPATVALMVVGLVAGAAPDRGGRRTTAAYFAMAVVLALVSLGPIMQWSGPLDPSIPGPWALLARVVPGFGALRVAARAHAIAVLGGALIAACGAQAAWSRARRPLARAVAVVVLLTIGAFEGSRPPLYAVAVPWAAQGVPPVYDWLAGQPGRDAVVELPIGLPLADATAMVMSARHWKPLVNGYSGFTPTSSFFRASLYAFGSPESLRLLHELGVRWVVVHPPDLAPAQARVCDAHLDPHAVLAYRDASACAFEIRSAPPSRPAPNDRPVPLAGARVTASTGADTTAVTDGRLDTHWTARVDPRSEDWLQVDLPTPRPITRVVVHLGPHFGEFMRAWRVDTSRDGITWTPVGTAHDAIPPLSGMRTDPARLASEMRLSAAGPTRHLRLVRLGAASVESWDVWPNWTVWGVHELELYEAP